MNKSRTGDLSGRGSEKESHCVGQSEKRNKRGKERRVVNEWRERKERSERSRRGVCAPTPVGKGLEEFGTGALCTRRGFPSVDGKDQETSRGLLKGEGRY